MKSVRRRGRSAWPFRLLTSGATAGWMGLIFYLSSQTSPPGSGMFSWLGFLRDMLGHLGMYWVLGSLGLACTGSWKAAASRHVGWGLLVMSLGSAYGLLDEYHQTFVPGRSASPLDVLVDAAGVAAGVSTLWGVARLRRGAER